MASIIYSHPLLYHLVMRTLHGRDFPERYETVAAEIPDGSSVVELCAGDAWLYRHYLKPKNVSYVGLEIAPAFLQSAKSRGINFREWEAATDAIPQADIVILQASLHLLHEHAATLLDRMLNAARQKVIIAEPIKNMADSENKLVAWIGRLLTRPHGKGVQTHTYRYNAASFESLMRQYPECERVCTGTRQREMLAVLQGRASARTPTAPKVPA